MAKEYLATQTWVMDQIKRFAGGGNLGELAVFNDIIQPLEFSTHIVQDTGTLVSNVDVTKDANNRKINIKTTFKKAPANATVEICAVSKSTFNFDKWIDMGYKYLNVRLVRDSGSVNIAPWGAAVFLIAGNTISSKNLVEIEPEKTGDFKIDIESLRGQAIGLKIRSIKDSFTAGVVFTTHLATVSGWTLTAL